ncbi:urease accessory protein [Mesorhizobium sp. Root552]|uniref:HupE/UreJ family protein n=1 Tax=Mesorhizobium sp. Root552 TaxID=1736555 RepID=UPI0006F9839B|nr:HupE/UreJ family protein [Mesorhizobium sp. Root552]KQZ31853.1 urease accessory protein [Mesorhizobium sp. Root552]
MKRTSLTAFAAAAILAASSTIASAHVGVGDTGGFAHGFMHPIGGIDHILAMVMVGLFAAQLGGRAMWLVPAAFVGVMAIGGVVGFSGLPLPFVELGIGLSIVVLGAAVAFGLKPVVAAATGLVGFFAVFHGFAHGAEMPDSVAGLAYGAGFVVATALLHAAGLGIGLLAASSAGPRGETMVRAAGALTAVAGVAVVTGVI